MGTLTNKEDLQNLLKEKEKGCGTCITIGISYSHCGFRNEFFCDNCKDKISILKQALEVIENERNDIRNELVGLNAIESKFKEGILKGKQLAIQEILEIIDEINIWISDKYDYEPQSPSIHHWIDIFYKELKQAITNQNP